MTFEEIADETGLSVSKVIRLYNSGMKKLNMAAEEDTEFREYLISVLAPAPEPDNNEFMRILNEAEEKEMLHNWYDCSIITPSEEYEEYKGEE